MKSEFESLYTKYRPRTFKDLIGQEHVAIPLIKAFEKKRLVQAYLFCGSRGCGKTTTARILAMGYNCEQGETPYPCGECNSCKDILANRCVDIVEIDAASKNGINDIRDLQMSAVTVPTQVKTKIYIIDEVHRMTTNAQDAFLKTLEEPPPNVVFVLCTTEPEKLKDTILSRTQVSEFRRIPAKKIADRLMWIAEQEGYTADPEAILSIAKTCEGGVRDAIVKLEQAICATDGKFIDQKVVNLVMGTGGVEYCSECVQAIIRQDVPTVLQMIGKAADSAASLVPFYTNLLNHTRNLMILSSNPEFVKSLDITETREQALLAEAKMASTPFFLHAVQTIMKYGKMLDSIKGRIAVETMCLEIIFNAPERPTVANPVAVTSSAAPQPVIKAVEPPPIKSITWDDLKNQIPAKLLAAIEKASKKPSLEDGVLTVYTTGIDDYLLAFVQHSLPSCIQKIPAVKSFAFSEDSSPNEVTVNLEDVFGG